MAAVSAIKSAGINPLNPIGMILDGALADIEKRLAASASAVHDAALDIVNQAGEQAFRVIASLKGAYSDSLELTYQKADALMQQSIDRAIDLTNTIMTGSRDAILKVADRVEDIIRLSPLSKWWLPLLSETTPRFFAVDAHLGDTAEPQMTPVLITFRGNFAYADRPGCTPSFQLNGTPYKPSVNTMKMLQFLINVSSKDPKLALDTCSYLSGSLTVLWQSGYVPGPWSWTTSNYSVLLGMLPAAVGKIQVVYTKPASMTTRMFISPSVQITRTKDHWTEGTFSASSHAGWQVMPGTARLEWLDGGPHGECVADLLTTPSNPNELRCKYSRKDGDGAVRIVFMEGQEIPKRTRLENHDDLRWGSSFIARPEEGEAISQINFLAFNGSRTEFLPQSDTSNPFIVLRKTEHIIQVMARRAADISDGVIMRGYVPDKSGEKLELKV